MILSDRDIKKRLRTPKQVGLKPDFLERLKRRDIPKELDLALDRGYILMDPIPLPKAFDADTVDLRFGNIIEVADVILEVVTINGRVEIRRATKDYRYQTCRLESNRKVLIEDETRIKFILDDDETLEIQPDMLILAHTLELVCVPKDLQMEMGGRSRLARDGLTSHVSSPVFHAGWCGHAVMEIKNASRLSFNVYPGLEFSSICFRKLSSKPSVPYYMKQGAKFSGQR